MKALVVDDSRAMRLMLKKFLQGQGFSEIFDAPDGEQALGKLRELGPIDLVLIDWNMPVMNGLEFTTLVRADKRFDNSLLMMVTAESDPSNIALALSTGVDEYVVKPFTADVLREKLAMLGFVVAA